MKTITSILVCFIFLHGIAQQHDTSFVSHVRVIKNPKKVGMPEIINSGFCEKLNALNIGDSIRFEDDDGQEVYYYLSIQINFSAKGKVISIMPRVKGKSISGLVKQIAELLRTADWRVSNRKQNIIFECMLKNGVFKDVALKTLNNYQKQMVCE